MPIRSFRWLRSSLISLGRGGAILLAEDGVQTRELPAVLADQVRVLELPGLLAQAQADQFGPGVPDLLLDLGLGKFAGVGLLLHGGTLRAFPRGPRSGSGRESFHRPCGRPRGRRRGSSRTPRRGWSPASRRRPSTP